MEPQPQSQENTITLDEEADALEAKAKAKWAREIGAKCLGGFRAADDYRAARFIPSKVTTPAFDAATSFDAATENLYLFGPTGSGKSHLAVIAARRSFERPGSDWPNRVRTLTPMEISRAVRACDGAAQEDRALEDIINRKVLVLEDIGVAKDTEFLVSIIYEIINRRYQNNAGGLIVTSNLGLGELAAKLGDDRVSSRLVQMCRVFNLAAESDHRMPARKT